MYWQRFSGDKYLLCVTVKSIPTMLCIKSQPKTKVVCCLVSHSKNFIHSIFYSVHLKGKSSFL